MFAACLYRPRHNPAFIPKASGQQHAKSQTQEIDRKHHAQGSDGVDTLTAARKFRPAGAFACGLAVATYQS